jgi:hypothetical protein
LNEDIHYLNGQIDALTALLLAVAGNTMSKHDFRESGLQRLQAVETALLPEAVPETRLIAIEHMRQWLVHQTS